MFDNVGNWEPIDQVALEQRQALEDLQQQDAELGESHEWIRAKKAARAKRSPLVVGAIVLVIAVMALMAVLVLVAYAGVHIEPLSHLWTPWPSDTVKIVGAALVIFGCVALLASEPRSRARD